MTDAGKAALYLRSILEELNLEQNMPTPILADNHGAIQLSNAQQPTKHTRHVDMKHFVILDWTQEDKIIYKPTPTQYNISDSISKPNDRTKHHEHNDLILGHHPPPYAPMVIATTTQKDQQNNTHNNTALSPRKETPQSEFLSVREGKSMEDTYDTSESRT
eukprot:Nitzschia sp. Nitz4//scaffold38_size140716//77320//77802//NITZ4_003147-RA/size140716-exonerate_protein2genome-gene-0.105-mRNA-1//-1//CDS//3329550078//3438//frame0